MTLSQKLDKILENQEKIIFLLTPHNIVMTQEMIGNIFPEDGENKIEYPKTIVKNISY